MSARGVAIPSREHEEEVNGLAERKTEVGSSFNFSSFAIICYEFIRQCTIRARNVSSLRSKFISSATRFNSTWHS